MLLICRVTVGSVLCYISVLFTCVPLVLPSTLIICFACASYPPGINLNVCSLFVLLIFVVIIFFQFFFDDVDVRFIDTPFYFLSLFPYLFFKRVLW